MAKKSLFISHAKKDRELATAIVELLLNGTSLEVGEVINASLEEAGIPAGKDFISYLKSKIGTPNASLVLLTPNYLTSRFCLCELGAVWALSEKVIPLLVPPLTSRHLQELIAENQLLTINDPDHLNSLVSVIREQLELDNLNLSRWAMEKKKFLGAIKTYLK
jgi:hypothetical protein